MFIKESMRIHPPVPSIGRHLDDPLRLSKDATIPPNCNVWVHIMATHRSEHLWEEPEVSDIGQLEAFEKFSVYKKKKREGVISGNEQNRKTGTL